MKLEKGPEKETTQPGRSSQLPLYPRSVLDVDMITSSILSAFFRIKKPNLIVSQYFSIPHPMYHRSACRLRSPFLSLQDA